MSQVTIRLAADGVLPPTSPMYSERYGASLAVPIALAGLDPGAHVVFETLESEIEAPDGRRWTTVMTPTSSPEGGDVESYVRFLDGGETGRLTVAIKRPLYRQLAGHQVTLRGKVGAMLHRYGDTVTMPAEAMSQAVPGLGRCTSQVVDYVFGRQMLTVVCESPHQLPILVPVSLRIEARAWNQRLGDSSPDPSYPSGTMLSPLYRLQTLFHISEELKERDGTIWLVPREVLPNAHVEVTPVIRCGSAVVSYELRDIDLSKYLVKSR